MQIIAIIPECGLIFGDPEKPVSRGVGDRLSPAPKAIGAVPPARRKSLGAGIAK
ncbi:hypothetical protein [Marinactinospora rubrisoli]|uniref:Uncharacterized protein n=1 Tax=Marinactinospora rubrisoli TaxID=2715399 RepID=A0ABW2KKM7_9ACTN